jgi:hypothetical protein
MSTIQSIYDKITELPILMRHKNCFKKSGRPEGYLVIVSSIDQKRTYSQVK